MMKQQKVLTYNEVMEQIKGIPLENLTKQQAIDRYVAYGRSQDFKNVEIQKLLCKHDLIEWLIYSVTTIITDQSVIDQITLSEIFSGNEYVILRGKIKSLELMSSKDLPNGVYLLSITIIGRSSQKEFKIEYLYTSAEKEYKNEIEQNIGESIMAVVRKETNDNKDNVYLLCCLLKSKRGLILRT